MNITVYQGVSMAIFIAHSLGFLIVFWGIWGLLKGVRGEGQSAEGIAELRKALLKLFQPMIWGSLALLSLLVLTFYEHSPLTQFIQVIAPLSTLIWMIWSHFSASKIEPGEMFEALVPLASNAQSKEVSLELQTKAQEWSNQGHPLTPKALAQTALCAIDDSRAMNPTPHALSLDDLLIVARDSLADTQQACLQFPLGQKLTLADWIFEGDRLTDIWDKGLKRINRGRALINPLTLLDHKSLWGWSAGKPGPLFQKELSAWLHHGLYLLVVCRLQELQEREQSRASTNESKNSKNSKKPKTKQVNPIMTEETPPLWRLLTRKLTVPFWLYWIIGSVAVTINHHLIGGLLSLVAGGLLWFSLDHATSIKHWRTRFNALGRLTRASRADDEVLNQAVNQLITSKVEDLKTQSKTHPITSMLNFAQDTSAEIAKIYRRTEHQEAPLALLNATIVDALLTAELICDDLIKWREKGGLLSKIIWLLSKFGVDDQRVETLLLDSARSWVQEADSSHPLHDLENANINGEEIQKSNEIKELSLAERAERADQWLAEEIADLNIILRKAAEIGLEKLVDSLNEWLSEELIQRTIPLYQGSVTPCADSEDPKS